MKIISKRIASVAAVFALIVCSAVSASAEGFPPASVSGLKARLMYDGKVQLCWDKAYGASEYTIEKSKDFDKGYEIVAEKLKSLLYVDRECDDNTYYRVTAQNAFGKSNPVTIVPGAYLSEYFCSEAAEGVTVVEAKAVGDYVYTGESGDSTIGVYKIAEGSAERVDSQKYKTFDATNIFVHKGYLYVTAKPAKGNDVLLIYSLENPEKPKRVKNLLVPNAYDLYAHDGTLWCAVRGSGVYGVDISKPEEAFVSVKIADVGSVNTIYVDDRDILYIGTSNTLHTKNIYNPDIPLPGSSLTLSFEKYDRTVKLVDRATGEVKINETMTGFTAKPSDICGKDDVVYLGTNFGLKAIKAEGLKNLQYALPIDDELIDWADYQSMTVDGDLLFTTNKRGSFSVYNISVPENPIEVERHTSHFGDNRTLVGISAEKGRVVIVYNDGKIAVYK